VNNEGLLHSKDVLNISADTLNNEKNIVANKVTLSIDTRMNNQVNAKILADEQLLIIKQTVGVPLTKFLEVINARLLAFKNILKDNAQISATGQLIIKNIPSATGQLIIKNILKDHIF
jgi:hypothetical protein